MDGPKAVKRSCVSFDSLFSSYPKLTQFALEHNKYEHRENITMKASVKRNCVFYVCVFLRQNTTSAVKHLSGTLERDHATCIVLATHLFYLGRSAQSRLFALRQTSQSLQSQTS